jgi:hypothetical protein
MNITAYHDGNGDIVALVTRSDDAPPVHLTSLTAVRAVDVQEPSLTADMDLAEVGARLAELRESHRVDIGTGAARLIER